MTDQEFEDTKGRLEALFGRWQPLLVPADWQVTYEFDRTGGEVGADNWVDVMSTRAKWSHLSAHMLVNMPALEIVDTEDGKLETHVIHELLHIPLAQVRALLADDELDHEEHVVSTLTQVIHRVARYFYTQGRVAGRRDARHNPDKPGMTESEFVALKAELAKHPSTSSGQATQNNAVPAQVHPESSRGACPEHSRGEVTHASS